MTDSYKDQTIEIYNSHAQEYKKNTENFVFPGEMFEYFVGLLEADAEILDIGCAFGRDIGRLRKLGYNAQGLEISSALIQLADEETKKYITQGDMAELKHIFSGKKFDAILSIASILHLDHGIGIDVFKQIYNLLEPHGYFFLSLKVADTRKIEYKNSISTDGIVKKYVYYGEEEIEEILKDIGFKITKTHSWKPNTDTWKILICKK